MSVTTPSISGAASWWGPRSGACSAPTPWSAPSEALSIGSTRGRTSPGPTRITYRGARASRWASSTGWTSSSRGSPSVNARWPPAPPSRSDPATSGVGVGAEPALETAGQAGERIAEREVEGGAERTGQDPAAVVDGGDGHALGQLDDGEDRDQGAVLEQRDE